MLHLCYVDAIGSSPGVSLCTQELESEGTSVSMSDQNTELVSTCPSFKCIPSLATTSHHHTTFPHSHILTPHTFPPYSFGSGQISVSKYVGHICTLLGDANSQVSGGRARRVWSQGRGEWLVVAWSLQCVIWGCGQVRTSAVDTMVEIYRHVGVKVRIDLSKRNLPPQKLAMLSTKFDEIDGTHGNVSNDQEVCQLIFQSLLSTCTLPPPPPPPQSYPTSLSLISSPSLSPLPHPYLLLPTPISSPG